jgi:branched-chain amino acid transport system substrate-binding protein
MTGLRQLASVVVCVALAGCSGPPAPAANPPASATSAPPGGEPYKLGVTFPMTGPLAAFGTAILPGFTIAADDLNKAGGIKGHPVQLVIEDSKGTPEAGVAAMRKVVDVDKVPVVLTGFTNVVSAQMALADDVKVPILAPSESPGLVAKSEWAFAHAPTYAQTSPLLQAHWKATGVKSIFALFPNNPLAEYYSPITKKVAQDLGAQYDEARFALGSTDFRGLLAKAKDSKPEAILQQGQCTADDGAVIKQARELGINATIYQGGGCFTDKNWRDATGSAAEGMVYAAYKFDPAKSPTLTSAYQAKMGYEPSYSAVLAYDMVLMVKNAIEQNGYNSEGIRKGLAGTRDLPSIGGGTITMGADHQTSPTVTLYRVQSGKAVEIQPGQ